MIDRILTTFLERQREEALALAAASDIVALVPMAGDPPRTWLAHFDCAVLVRTAAGEVRDARGLVAAIWFHEDHLKHASSATLVTILEPRDPDVFHPNVRGPYVCLGRVAPGMGIVDACFQLYEIFTYGRFRLNDVLNEDAARWARGHLDRFPLERRSLRRPRTAPTTAAELSIEIVEVPS